MGEGGKRVGTGPGSRGTGRGREKPSPPRLDVRLALRCAARHGRGCFGRDDRPRRRPLPRRRREVAIARKLGSGGFGVVYEAHDRERGERVAPKVLRDVDPDALYRFKKEFRTLAWRGPRQPRHPPRAPPASLPRPAGAARPARRPGALVLLVDDLQWGDLDGAALLQELLRPRAAAAAPRPRLPQRGRGDEPPDRRPPSVRDARGPGRPLGPDEARDLARTLLGEAALVEAIVREAGGNPFQGLFGAAAGLGLGAVLGGDEGRALEDGAKAALAAQAVIRPERTADLLAPSRAARVAGTPR